MSLRTKPCARFPVRGFPLSIGECVADHCSELLKSTFPIGSTACNTTWVEPSTRAFSRSMPLMVLWICSPFRACPPQAISSGFRPEIASSLRCSAQLPRQRSAKRFCARTYRITHAVLARFLWQCYLALPGAERCAPPRGGRQGFGAVRIVVGGLGTNACTIELLQIHIAIAEITPGENSCFFLQDVPL
jgi:hypothetical protein